MQDYTVQIEGFILGSYYRKDQAIRLHPQQARTFLLEERIAPAAAKNSGKAKKAI